MGLMPLILGTPILFEDQFNAETFNTGRWTKVDTESKITQASGLLSFSGGKASPAWGDPAVVGPAVTRRIGVALYGRVSKPSAAVFSLMGFADAATPPSSLGNYIEGAYFRDTVRSLAGSSAQTLADYSTNTTYEVLVILGSWAVSTRSLSTAGSLLFIRGGAFTTWTLLWRDVAVTTTPIYPAIASFNAAPVHDAVRVYQHPFPMPRVYDSMVRANGAIGSAESGQAYTNVNNTATIVSNEGTFPSAANNDIVVIEAGVGDGIASLDVKGDVGPTDVRLPQLIVRYVDSSNYLRLTLNDANNALVLQKVDGGSASDLASGATSGSDDTYLNISVQMINSALRAFKDGSLIFTHTLAGGDATKYANTVTKIGVRLRAGGSPTVAARFKNLLFQPGLGV